jgi:hypothetical protein
MSKVIKFGTEARAKMLNGVDILANAVKVTLKAEMLLWTSLTVHQEQRKTVFL